jgi:hypothetical protein
MKNKFLERLKAIAKKILYFNLRYYLEYRFGIKTQPSDVENYLSVVAIVKNEASYIEEWLEYHLLVGIEKFYIYDNGSTDNLKEVLAPYIDSKIVEYYYYPGTKKQVPAYNASLKKVRKKSFWVALIDIDEFIVPISTQTITEFLRDFENKPGVEINWVVYGSSGEKCRNEGLVIERFRRHSNYNFIKNRHVKTIFNAKGGVCLLEAHNAKYFGKSRSVNIHNEINDTYFLNREPLHDLIRINHYFSKSEEEYLQIKLARGAVDVGKKSNKTMKDFHEHDKNDIEDDIMDKYVTKVKENLKKRRYFDQ